MKKIILLLICILPFNVLAENLIDAKFKKCVDGDTAYLIIDGEEVKVRLLAIDTPETKHPKKGKESGGETASTYTCNRLKEANSIQIEYDEKSDLQDKYGRTLVWLYLDGKLLQSDLISNGYAEVNYIYGKYKYVDELCNIQREAINNNLGIWENGSRKEGYCSTKKNNSSKNIKEETSTKEDDNEDVNTPFFLILVLLYFLILLFKNMVIKKK